MGVQISRPSARYLAQRVFSNERGIVVGANHRPVVMKFGGSSVEDATAFKRVSRIVRSRTGQRPVVVVSAMMGVTDALFAAVGFAIDGKSEIAVDLVDTQLRNYDTAANQLLDTDRYVQFVATLEKTRIEIVTVVESFRGRKEGHPLFQDVILSYGERLSAKLLAHCLASDALDARYVDARRLIVTNEDHGRAEPIIDRTYSNIERELSPLVGLGVIPVLGGFIGSHIGGGTTTLGRNGSDFSAALVGGALNAREVEIWTDVNGILSADPRIVNTAATVPHFSYDEAAALSYFGAKVLHPKTVRPAAERMIPIRILNSRLPESPGTIVSSKRDFSASTAKTIVCKNQVSVLLLTGTDSVGNVEFTAKGLEVLRSHQAEVLLSSGSGSSLTVVLDAGQVSPGLLSSLESIGQVDAKTEKALIAVVGHRLNNAPGILARIFDCLAGFDVSLIADGRVESTLSLIADQSKATSIVMRLHDELFSPNSHEYYRETARMNQVVN